MRNSSKYLYSRSCLICVLLGAAAYCWADTPMIKLTARPMVWGGSSHNASPSVLAGSLFFLRVANTTDISQDTLKPGWPEGYHLEASLDLPKGSNFIPTVGLIERLNPEPFFSYVSRGEEYRMLHEDSTEIDLERLNTKEFALHLPSDLIGHSLAFRVLFESHGISIPSNCTDPIVIIAPSNRCDTARVIASYMYIAWKKWTDENMRRAIEIADSMLANNLSDAFGWETAMSAATALGLPEKKLVYLDRLYQDFGVALVGYGEPIPPPMIYQGPPKPQQQELYLQKRTMLLQRIAEQQQR